MRSNPGILVVDDDGGIQQKLREHLQSAGFSVLEARTWRKALDLFASEKPIAVILDMDLAKSEVGGAELTRIFRKSRNYRSPIIIYSASSERATTALDEGASAFVQKPAPVEELVSTLLRLLEKCEVRDGG